MKNKTLGQANRMYINLQTYMKNGNFPNKVFFYDVETFCESLMFLIVKFDQPKKNQIFKLKVFFLKSYTVCECVYV